MANYLPAFVFKMWTLRMYSKQKSKSQKSLVLQCLQWHAVKTYFQHSESDQAVFALFDIDLDYVDVLISVFTQWVGLKPEVRVRGFARSNCHSQYRWYSLGFLTLHIPNSKQVQRNQKSVSRCTAQRHRAIGEWTP